MEVNISLEKNAQGNLCIENKYNEEKIIIDNSSKELKASDILRLLDYSSSNIYKIDELTEEQRADKYILSVEKIFREIIDKINNKAET